MEIAALFDESHLDQIVVGQHDRGQPDLGDLERDRTTRHGRSLFGLVAEPGERGKASLTGREARRSPRPQVAKPGRRGHRLTAQTATAPPRATHKGE